MEKLTNGTKDHCHRDEMQEIKNTEAISRQKSSNCLRIVARGAISAGTKEKISGVPLN